MEATQITKKLYQIIFLILVLLEENTVLSFRQYLSSPCPNIFQYQFENTGTLYGSIRINSPQGRKIQLDVELSVGNTVQGYNGNIQLLHNKQQVIIDITNGRPIDYKVYFPAWKGIPPKITKIEVNGNLICSGPKIPLRLVPVLTTINLQHILTVDVTNLLASSVPVFDNQQDSSEISNTFDIREYDIEIPIDFDSANNGNGLKRENPFLGNNNFNPPPPRRPPPPPPGGPPPPRGPPPESVNRPPRNGGRSNSNNNINFNPQMPKDPTRIYSGNPFLNNLSSTPKSSGFDTSGNGQANEDSNTAINPFFNVRTSSERPPLVDTNPNIPGRGPVFDVEPSINFRPDVSTSISNQPYGDICGQSLATNSLIVDGNSVPNGAYPWLAALFGIKPTGLSYMCSGSLISNKHVVTAAHCVKISNKQLKPQDLLIILGKLNIQRWTPGNGEKMIEPESIHIHRDYNFMTSDADIAILILSEVVEFTKYIRPLCLWDGTNDLGEVIGKKGTVVGWGRDEHDSLMTAEPKQIDLPIVSQEQCLRSDPRFSSITSDRTFCAGSRNGSGPCNGDSGSGFIMKKNGRYMLRGIVSTATSEIHKKTCDLSNYVVFTDASKFSNWLISFIK